MFIFKITMCLASVKRAEGHDLTTISNLFITFKIWFKIGLFWLNIQTSIQTA